MVHPVTYGKRVRMSYSRIDEVLEMPDLIEVQKSSYQWFLGRRPKRGIRGYFSHSRLYWKSNIGVCRLSYWKKYKV